MSAGSEIPYFIRMYEETYNIGYILDCIENKRASYVCYNDILPEIDMEKSPEELIVLVNRILDVGHMSGDLASAFIEGGSKSLREISERGYITE